MSLLAKNILLSLQYNALTTRPLRLPSCSLSIVSFFYRWNEVRNEVTLRFLTSFQVEREHDTRTRNETHSTHPTMVTHRLQTKLSQDSSVGSRSAWYWEVPGPNPGKGENFSIKIINFELVLLTSSY